MKLFTFKDIAFSVPTPKWEDCTYQSKVTLPDHKIDLSSGNIDRIDVAAWENSIHDAVAEIKEVARQRNVLAVEQLAVRLKDNFRLFHSYITQHLAPHKIEGLDSSEKERFLAGLKVDGEEVERNLRILGMFFAYPIYRTLTLKLFFSERKQLEIRYSELNSRVAELASNFLVYTHHMKVYLG